MTTKQPDGTIRIILAAISICCALLILSIAVFQRPYNMNFIDQLTDSLLTAPDEQQLDRLLSYRRYHSVDAAFSLHYHACLWAVYTKYPEFFLRYTKGRYENIVHEVITQGEEMFADFYPDGRESRQRTKNIEAQRQENDTLSNRKNR
ncbi:MAG: hypothetical protein ACL93V_00135 [Candidatus Electrothrix sp. YB6]